MKQLEESLYQYFVAEDECRAFCDGEFDHGNWYPDFITSIGSKFFFCSVRLCSLDALFFVSPS